jgi:hypothetical protein
VYRSYLRAIAFRFCSRTFLLFSHFLSSFSLCSDVHFLSLIGQAILWHSQCYRTEEGNVCGIRQNSFYKLCSKKGDAWEEVGQLLGCCVRQRKQRTTCIRFWRRSGVNRESRSWKQSGAITEQSRNVFHKLETIRTLNECEHSLQSWRVTEGWKKYSRKL